MHIIVAGSTTLELESPITDVLSQLVNHTPVMSVTTGLDTPVDRTAKLWAHYNNIESYDFPADWRFHRNDGNVRKAGPIRNRQMVLTTLDRFPKEEVSVFVFTNTELDKDPVSKNIVETADKQSLPIFVYRVDADGMVTFSQSFNFNPLDYTASAQSEQQHA